MIRNPALAAACAVAMLVGIVAPAMPAASAELRFVSVAGERNALNRRLFVPWANEVALQSGGSLTIRMGYDSAPQRGGAGQFARALDGAADLTWGRQHDTAGLFRKTLLIELPGTGNDPVDATRRLWRAYDRHLAAEYASVKVIAIWAGPQPLLHTKNNPVRMIGAAQGLRIRTRSPHRAWLIEALGATPVRMAAGKLYDAMDRSLIHGVVLPAGDLYRLKVDEVSMFHSAGIGWGHSPFFAVMNRKSYRGLSKALRDIIDRTSGLDLSIKAAQVSADEDRKSRDRIRSDRRRVLIEIAPRELAKADVLMKRAEADLIGRIRNEGIDLIAALNALRGAGG